MAYSKQYNHAGKTYVVDRIIEKKSTASIDAIKQYVSLAANKKEIEDLKNSIINMAADGIISPEEKQTLKREWANLSSSYYKTQNQFANDSDLNTSSYWILLQSKFQSLENIMIEVLDDMNTSYVEANVGQISDLFVECWENINGCSMVYENSIDFSTRYELRIIGNLEFNTTTTLSAAVFHKASGTYTSFPSSEFSWYRVSDNSLIQAESITATFDTDDMGEDISVEFVCIWLHNADEYGDANASKIRIVRFFTLSYKEITQYQWSNALAESSLDKSDVLWTTENQEQPSGLKYQWVRTSKDNGKTWSYFRRTGQEGPQGPVGPTGWSNAYVPLYKWGDSQPDPFDGGVITYNFATGAIIGNTGTWSAYITTKTGDNLYVVYGSFLTQGETDTIQPNEWTTPAIMSTIGNQGEPGISVATVFIYIRSNETPALPASDATFSFTNNILTGVSPWYQTVPPGNEKCWVSTATATSRTASAVIEPSKWSEPVILVQNGADGTGIKSAVKEYAVNTSETEPPAEEAEWSDTMPERVEGEVIWERLKITYTDDSVIYTGYNTIIGMKGDPGQSAPEIKIQYAWGVSNINPPSLTVWVWRNSFMLFWRKMIGNFSGSQFSDTLSAKPDDGIWYLWIRFSTDGGKTWQMPKCIQSEAARDFQITGSGQFEGNRDVVVVQQKLKYTVSRINELKGNCVWMVDSASSSMGVTFDNASEDGTYSGDIATLIIPVGFKLANITIIATIGELVREFILTMYCQNDVREYIGVFQNGEHPDTALNGKPLMTGDSIVSVVTDGDGNTTSTIEVYVIKDGIGEWQDTSEVLDFSNTDYSSMIWSIVMDATYDMTSLTNSGIQPKPNNLGWSFFRDIGVVTILAASMYTNKLRLEYDKNNKPGSIYSGAYDGDGNNSTGGKGTYIGADGTLKAVEAYLTKAIIYGQLFCADDAGTVFYTALGSTGKTLPSPSKSRWAFSEFRALNPVDEIITYDSKKYVVKKFKTTRTVDEEGSLPENAEVTVTIPYTGSYNVYINLYRQSGTGNTSSATVYKNGVQIYRISLENRGMDSLSETRSFDFTAGDLVRLYISGNRIAYGYATISEAVPSLYFTLSGSNTTDQVFKDDTEYYLSKQIYYSDFDSNNIIKYSDINNYALELEKIDTIYSCIVGETIKINGVDTQILYLVKRENGLDIMTKSGSLLHFDYPDTTTDIATTGYYQIEGDITLLKAARGIQTDNILPISDSVSIGSSESGKRFASGYFGALNANGMVIDNNGKFEGNVNDDESRELYKVWGAVAN